MTLYYDAHRELQDRFDTRRLADRLEDQKVHDELSEADAQFVATSDMLFLATSDPEGQPTCCSRPASRDSSAWSIRRPS